MYIGETKYLSFHILKMTSLCLVLIGILFFAPDAIKGVSTWVKSALRGDNMTISISNTTLRVGVADKFDERIRGLSGRKGLDKDEGLLFIFDKDEKYGIWMNEMNFIIDIIWLDRNGMVVHIEENISPNTYPKVFYPLIDAKYVLEVNSGFTRERGVKLGDFVDLF
jgi:uncharacterized protein